MRDESAERVSLSRKVHIPVGEQEAPGPAAEPETAEVDQDVDMVTRCKMTFDRFLTGTRPTTQPQGKDRTPPPPLPGRAKKKQCVVDQQIGTPTNVPLKTPPRISIGIVIWEPVGDSRPTPQTGTNVASSSQPEVIW